MGEGVMVENTTEHGDGASAADTRVVVTGLGAVSGWGWGVEPLWQALRAGRTGIGHFDRFDATAHRTQVASQVPDTGAGDDLANARGAHRARLSLADYFAVEAGWEALRDAALDGDLEHRELGVYFGSSTGAMWESERYYSALIGRDPRCAKVSWVASQEYNGPGDALARALGTSGPVESISSACASGALAIGAALDALRLGEVDVAVAGGSDSLCQLTYAGFNGLRAVASEPCVPFREERDGMSLGEGAAVLVMERLSSARQRGAKVRGAVLGAGASCDAHHMTAPQASGEGPAAAIQAALADAGVDPRSIDFVNAHGTGTPLNDRAEAAALHRIFGERARQLPITSTKGSVGHLLGSAGALEALVTLLCLEAGEVHPTPGPGPVEEALQVRLVVDQPLSLQRSQHALSTNLAFGGANAALVLAAGETG